MGYLLVIRPINCLITFISVLCGAWIGREIILNHKIFFAGITGFLVCAFGNTINDIMDIEIDRINNPRRPLITGQAKKDNALFLGVLFGGVAVIMSFFLGLKPFLLVTIAILFLLFYSCYFKKTPWGNLFVAITAGLSFILGGFITNNVLSLIPGFFALLIHIPREIIKDIIDISGDRQFGVKSLPIIYGEERARKIARIFLFLLLGLSPLPYILGIFNLRYLLVLIWGAFPLIVFAIIKIDNYPFASNLMKVIMLVGLIAFIIG
ncbi:MAG: geranylgeranylglycerol-phosphate geranylgeranyltransferase [candidate division WOR-3 bacterium]